MNGFVNLSRKEFRFSFIRVKSDTQFECPFRYCSKNLMKETRYDWIFPLQYKDMCRQQKVLLKKYSLCI